MKLRKREHENKTGGDWGRKGVAQQRLGRIICRKCHNRFGQILEVCKYSFLSCLQLANRIWAYRYRKSVNLILIYLVNCLSWVQGNRLNVGKSGHAMHFVSTGLWTRNYYIIIKGSTVHKHFIVNTLDWDGYGYLTCLRGANLLWFSSAALHTPSELWLAFHLVWFHIPENS